MTQPQPMFQLGMASPEFMSDMAGFDIADSLDVQTTVLDPRFTDRTQESST